MREVDGLVKAGNTFVVDADLKSYFGSIPHDRLMESLKQRISDGKPLDVIRLFLKQEVMEGMEGWTPTGGTPQGAVISPCLGKTKFPEPLPDSD